MVSHTPRDSALGVREEPTTNSSNAKGDTVVRGAKPSRDAVAVARERSKLASVRRPDFAEVAAQTLGARRFVSRVGVSIPVLLILATIAVSSTLGQPLRGGLDLGALILWALGTLLLLIPFIAALVVMLTARRGGLVSSTALVYSVLCGVVGIGVDTAVLGSDVSTASVSLVSALIVQVLLLAPVCAAVAFVISIARDSARR
ncbi:hypothetical protein [Brevibacterium oceani]|uniref:hypothetical protein n=1 Tax=Brevibacterium oceani TaxID=358099 RepID=UPI001B341C8B|nr:hypothetical protein [Brevibacterium oceani]